MPLHPAHRPDGKPRHRSAAGPSVGRRLADLVFLICLFGILLLTLLAEMPWLSRLVRSHLLQAAVVLVYTLIAAAGPASGRLTLAALRGPSFRLLSLLAWSGLVQFGAEGNFSTDAIHSLFGKHEQLGPFLVLLLPLGLALDRDQDSKKALLSAQGSQSIIQRNISQIFSFKAAGQGEAR